MQAARLCHGERRSAYVLEEQPIEVPRANADPGGELADRGLIERAFLDETQRAPHDRRGSEPRWCTRRSLGAAAETRPEARFGGRRRGHVIAHVASPGGRRCRADRTAVNARGSHGDEELAVEARIAAQARPLEHGGVEWSGVWHGSDDTPRRFRGLAIFGRVCRARHSAGRRSRSCRADPMTRAMPGSARSGAGLLSSVLGSVCARANPAILGAEHTMRRTSQCCQ
jgi:hypothetical protein